MQKHEELERELLEWGPNPVACSSGTAALHLALEAMQFPPWSRIVIPTFTMVACARAAVMADVEPVFADPDRFLEAIRVTRAAAVMNVHVYGRVDRSWYESVPPWCSIIEDCAEAHCVPWCSQVDAACWSFYRNKLVAGQEGGAVIFKRPEHAMLAKQLRCLGFTDAHDYDHVPRGHNYRLSEAHASLILDSWKRRNQELERRKVLCATADRVFGVRSAPRLYPWVYDLYVPLASREASVETVGKLNSAGVHARVSFKPLHTLDEFRACCFFGESSKAYQHWIYLGLGPEVTEETFVAAKRIVGK